MHKSKTTAGEGLLKWHVLLTPIGGRSEMETMTKSWGVTEVGQDREINHSHSLKGVIRNIPDQRVLRRIQEVWGGSPNLEPLVPHVIPGQAAWTLCLSAQTLRKLLTRILVFVDITV